MRKLISIITPAYNEEKNIPLYYEDVIKEIQKYKNKYDFEIILINDGSIDNTSEEIDKVVQRDKRFHFIEFSRNFGKEIATTAGLNNCNGDAAIMIDADLQFPLTKLGEFIDKWEKGNEVVVGIRARNKGEGFISNLGSKLFYAIMNRIGDTQVVRNATDYRLIDRVVINEFNKLTERTRITLGLIDWMGFKTDYVHFEANARLNGVASYSFVKKVRLAINSFIALSLFPLKLAGYLGVFIVFTTGTFGLIAGLGKYILAVPFFMSFSGTALLAVLIIFFVGIILSCLGLIALYVATIYGEVLNRPMYVIRRRK